MTHRTLVVGAALLVASLALPSARALAADDLPDDEDIIAVDDETTEPGGFFAELSEQETAQIAAGLRAKIEAVRGKVVDKLGAKIAAKQGHRLGQIAWVLFFISLCGVFLLFRPLWLRNRYPGKTGVLFKYSALSALLFFAAVNLFAGVLLTMRGAQAVTGSATNPQIRMVDATFDMLHDKAEDVAPVVPTLVQPAIAALEGGSESPALVVLLDNVQRFAQDFSVFASVGRWFKKLDFLFGLLPIILIGIALLIFFQAAWPTLRSIVRIPDRAAAGEHGVGRHATAQTLRAVWQELKATLCVIGVILAATLLAGLLLSFVLMPAIEIFIAYLVICLMYVQAVAGASSFWVVVSLMGTIVFLALNLVLIIAASALFIGKAQKIFQQKFRDGVPLRRHARFWKRGSLALVWSQLLPLLYILAFSEIVGWVVVKSMSTENWPLILAGGPVMFLVTFGIIYWAFRGFRSIGYIAKYKPAAVEPRPLQPAPMPGPMFAGVPDAQVTTPYERVAPPYHQPPQTRG